MARTNRTRPPTAYVLAIAALPGMLSGVAAGAQCEIALLESSEAGPGDQLGWSVDVSGDTIAAGARFDELVGVGRTGSVTIYERDGVAWVEVQRLTASDADDGDALGTSLSLDGTRLLVGSKGDDDGGADAGAAYVFEEIGGVWTETAKLVPASALPGDTFGEAVSLWGDHAAVGMHVADTVNPVPGRVAMFAYDGARWNETQMLSATGEMDGDHFGFAVALRDDLLLVGARQDDDEGEDSGSATFFQLVGDTWVEGQRVRASDAQPGDFFGYSVWLGDGIAFVGSRYDGHPGIGGQAGSVYVFEQLGGTWVETQKLVASDVAAGDGFGNDVQADDARLVVGAPDKQGELPDSGAAYLFERIGGSWTETGVLGSGAGVRGEFFGGAVALAGDTTAVGASGADGPATNAGSVHVVSASGTDFVSLAVDTTALSLAAGGTQTLTLEACSDHAGAIWWLLGSATGTSPGFDAGPVHLPLNVDDYTLFTIAYPNTLILPSIGFLDASANATAALALAPATDPSLAGITLHHAFVVLTSLSPAGLVFASEARPLALVP